MITPVPILLYHSVSDHAAEKFQSWAITPHDFSEHMLYLNDHGYIPLTVSQFVSCLDDSTALPVRKPVVITFDDGFADFYSNALPILNNYDFGATIYITSSFVGKSSEWLTNEGEGSRPMLSWHEIREISKLGIECGSHAQSHRELDTMPLMEAMQEISMSKQIMEEHLGELVESFAYPHGYHSDKIKSLVMEAGYTSACAVKHAMSSLEDDRYALARIIVKSNMTPNILGGLLEGKNLRVAPFREGVMTKSWRLFRYSKAMFRRRLAV
jgi:peptidoglycan/xylan/chitin deacetylase (PgdA/CDA1 family)